MKDKKYKNRGSLTLEASIGLVAFIFAFVALLSLCKFARTQVIMQHAVNQVAKEVSQYCYITNKFGLKRDRTLSTKTKQDTDNMIEETINFIKVLENEKSNIESIDFTVDQSTGDLYYDALMTIKKYDDAHNVIKDSYTTVTNETKILAAKAEEYLSNPVALLKGFVAIGVDEVADYAVSKYIAAPLSKILIKKYLPCGSLTPDEYLKSLGVKDGMSGLNFDLSTIHKDGKTINITLVYYMTLDIPLIPKKDMCYTVNASTISWGSDIKSTWIDSIQLPNTNYINVWDYGGERTTNEFIKIIQNERGYSTARTPSSLDYYDNYSNEFTYVHSMNTDMKSYVDENGILNLSQIKSKVKYYANKAVEAANKIGNVTMTDDTEYDNVGSRDKKYKVIIVIQKSSEGSSGELDKIKQEILKELKESNLEIEFYYSDGKIDMGD